MKNDEIPVMHIRVSSRSFSQRNASELKSYTLKAYAAFKSHAAPNINMDYYND